LRFNKNTTFVVLNEDFKKGLLKKYWTKHKLQKHIAKNLEISTGTFRNYLKYGYKIQLSTLNKIIDDLSVPKEILEKNIENKIPARNIIEKSLKKAREMGIEKRSWRFGLTKINKEKLWKKAFKKKREKTDRIIKNIKLDNIIIKNKIHTKELLQYFDSALKVHNGIKINKIKETKQEISITFNLLGATSKYSGEKTSPKYLKLNNDFLWFLGLWLGDRCGRSTMIGISTKELNTVEKVYDIFSNNFKQPKNKITVVLEYNKNENVSKYLKSRFNHVKINKSKNTLREWKSYKVKFNNTLIRFIFTLIEKRLNEFLDLLNKNQLSAFFAGFFDAEGTVFRKYLLYSQKTNKRLISTLREKLRQIGFETRYKYNSTIYINNPKKFAEFIYPNIRTNDKRFRLTTLLNYGMAISVDDVFFLWLVKKLRNPNTKMITDILNKSRSRVTEPLHALEKNNMVMRARAKGNEPHYVYMTDKGATFLQNNREHLNKMIDIISEYGAYKNKIKNTKQLNELINGRLKCLK